MKVLWCVLALCVLSCKGYSVYRVPSISDKVYKQAARHFPAVFQIRVRPSGSCKESYGTGSYVYHLETNSHYLLTAAHVLKPGCMAELSTPWGNIPLEGVRYFPKDLISFFGAQPVVFSFANLFRGERLYGGRIDKDDMEQAITQFGGDLAIAFLPSSYHLPLRPFSLATAFDPEKERHIKAVGFGVSGVMGSVGSYTGTVDGSGRKRAYHPFLKTGVVIQAMNLKTGQAWFHPSWMGISLEDQPTDLPGHVGYGDSGGPLLRQKAPGQYEIIGVISSTLPAAKSKQFLKKANPWQKFVLSLGSGVEGQSYLSYLLGQESNTYGSEALFSGVISPLVHEWIDRVVRAHNQGG
jgi:hypothetical protein